MPIRIRESHIRATIGDVQRQVTNNTDQLPERENQISQAALRQIADLVTARVERKLKKGHER